MATQGTALVRHAGSHEAAEGAMQARPGAAI